MLNRMLLEILRNEYDLKFSDIRHLVIRGDKIFYRDPDTREEEEAADIDFTLSSMPFLRWKGKFNEYNKGRHLRLVKNIAKQ